MKIWNNYGSEHSHNLVMIGYFQEIESAKEVIRVIDEIENYIKKSGDDHRDATRYSEKMLDLLTKIRFHSVLPSELHQFAYEYSKRLEDQKIVLTTDEIDISAYMKLMVDYGAKVEIYSAHDYKDTGEGR